MEEEGGWGEEVRLASRVVIFGQVEGGVVAVELQQEPPGNERCWLQCQARWGEGNPAGRRRIVPCGLCDVFNQLSRC